MTDPLETELKLEFDPADRGRLVSAGIFAGVDRKAERLVATYFDTPRREIREAGYSLRIRREGAKRVQTVKGGAAGAGLFVRAEWEREVDADTPQIDAASGPLAQAIGRAALTRLAPVFVTDVRRETRVLDVDAARFECAIDTGDARAGKRKLTICEIELELAAGSPASLFDFARRLDEVAPLRLVVLSKAERGYLLVDGDVDAPVKAEPIALDPEADAGDAFQAIARSCLRHFRRNESILLGTGAPEPLHQARVALRRLRTAMSLFQPMLAGDPRAELLDAELRWLAGELGQVRNLDVLIERAGRKMRDQLITVRRQAFEHVRIELASGRTRLLMLDLAEWLALGEWRTHPAEPALLRRNVVAFAADTLEARRRQLKHRGRRLAALDDRHRHKARIAAKKLRYATHFFGPLFTTNKARHRHDIFLEALDALQDHLGALNDLVIGQQLLARLGIESKPPRWRQRQRLLHSAEDAHEAVIDAKRFWR